MQTRCLHIAERRSTDDSIVQYFATILQDLFEINRYNNAIVQM